MNADTLRRVREHPLFHTLRQLNLSATDFVIVGSAPLYVHGYQQELRDIDVVARGAAWDRAMELGMPACGDISGDPTRQFLGGRIEVSQKWLTTSDTDDLIFGAECIEGLRFAGIDFVLQYKRALRRPKDEGWQMHSAALP